MKFLKRLFLFCFFIVLAACVWGYYNGARPDNYQVFIADFVAQYLPSDSIIVADKEKPVPLPKTKKIRKKRNELQPIPKNPFARIDQHARNCSNSKEKDVTTLATYLKKGATTDLEKARSIYVWLCNNIKYDDLGYNTGNYTDCSAEGVLANKRSVCAGYSSLYFALGSEMGLEIVEISGYAKGYGYTSGAHFYKTDHAWNMIKINNKWRVFDATWGTGYGTNVNGKLVSKKKFKDFWFNVDPYEAIFSHLPEDSDLAFVQPLLSLKKYEVFPNIDQAYFNLGFNAKETYKAVFSNDKIKFPDCYDLSTHVEMKKAPKHKVLKVGKKYPFEFYIPRGLDVAIVDSKNNWTYFENEKGIFSLSYLPIVEARGDLTINVKYDKGGKSYHTLITYFVNSTGELVSSVN